MKSFSGWLQKKTILKEFVLSFGKHKGKDHTQVPSDWLDWAIKQGISDPLLSQDDIAAIKKELAKRDYGYYAQPQQPKKPIVVKPPQGTAASQTPSAPKKSPSAPAEYILAIAKGSMGFKPGQKLAINKSDQGWEFTTLDGQKKQGTLPLQGIADIVQSVKYETGTNKGKPISSNDPRILKSIFNKDRGFPPVNPYKIREDRVTEEQKNIEKSFTSGKENIVISALAGTGKTTILKHLASFYKPGQKWLYIVFNKKNQSEAEELKFHEELGEMRRAFPPEIEVRTSHSFLGTVLKSNHAYNKIHPTELPKQGKNKKYKKITDVMARDWFVDTAVDTFQVPGWLLKTFTNSTKNLAEKAKNFAIHPDDPNIKKELENLIDSYDIDTKLIPDDQQTGKERDYAPEIIEAAIAVLKMTLPGQADPEWMSPEGQPLRSIRDQDDTLWYAAIHANELVWPHYDVVMADEVQDFNKAQAVMLQKLSEAGARIVAVGDVNQSIYRFRGGDSKSFGNVATMLANTDRGVAQPALSVNFRSGSHIIDYVNKHTHVNNLKAGRPDIDKEVKEEMQKEGKTLQDAVTEHKSYEEIMTDLVDEWNQLGHLKRPTALIARTNKPLVQAAMFLMHNKVPFEIVGSDFQDDLIKFVDEVVKKFAPTSTGKWKAKPKLSLEDFTSYMNKWVKSLDDEWNKLSDKEKAKNHAKETALNELRETAEAINSVIQGVAQNNWTDPESGRSVADTEEFKQYLNYIFKGRHEDTASRELEGRDPRSYVTITTAHKSKGLEWERVFIIRDDLFPHPSARNAEDSQQEENARYVAYTRGTHELHVLKDGEPGGKKKKKY